ncbi:MAG: hypothetical protein QOF89_1122 [Acidobacteriota bacterium]|nr:hypothetical protein [Acidobacteriota bacterium]
MALASVLLVLVVESGCATLSPAPRPPVAQSHPAAVRLEKADGEEGAENSAATRFWNFEYPRLIAGQTAAARQRQLVEISARLATGEVDAVSPAARWISRGPAPILYAKRHDIGRVDTIAVDPFDANVLFFGTPDGSLWRTRDGAASWSVFDAADCNGITSLAIDPRDSHIVYAGTFCGLFRTVDGGDHWSRLSSRTTDLDGVTYDLLGPVKSISIDPRGAGDASKDTLLVGSGLFGLLLSTDGGATFRESPGSPSWHDAESLVRDPANPAIVYATGLENKTPGNPSAGLVRVAVKSLDGGQHWSQVLVGPNDFRLILAIAPSAPNTLYAMSGACSPVHFFKTTDAGANWQEIATTADDGGALTCQTNYDVTLAVDPANPDRVYFGGIPLYISEDGGRKWKFDFAPHVDYHSLVFAQQGVLYAGTDGGIYHTSDRGNHWTTLEIAPSITEIYHVTPHPIDPRVTLAGSQDNGTFLRDGVTTAWKKIACCDGGKPLVDPTNPAIVYAVTQVREFSVLRSDDGGKTFSPKANGIDPGEVGPFIPPLAMSQADPKTLFMGLAHVYRSTDRGESWKAVSPALPVGGVSRLAVGEGSPARLFATNFSSLLTSADGGDSWRDVSDRLPVSCYLGFAIDRYDPQTAYVLTCWDELHGPLYRTRDGGASWTAVSGNLPQQLFPTSLVLIQPNPSYRALVLASDDGVFTSTDDGATWHGMSDGLPLASITELAYSDNGARLLAATFGRGVYELSCPPTPTALCLGNGRFRATVDWQTGDGRSGAAQAIALTSDTGYFWFFGPDNVEIVLKVLDACSFNNRFWVFVGGLTDVRAVVTVTDTLTGAVQVYVNNQGRAFQPIQDTAAFATCSAASAAASKAMTGYPQAAAFQQTMPWLEAPAVPVPRLPKSGTPCVPDGTSLCLANGRFRVSARWQTSQTQSGDAQAVALTADTGYFWFFGQDNVEVVVKVLDACTFNQRFWVFAGGLTDVAVSLTIVDTVTGATRTYTNPQGQAFQTIQDTSAFATCSG